MNKNIEILEKMIDPTDEWGQKYINLIKNVIEDGRIILNRKAGTAKVKKFKEKFFKNLNKEFIYCEVHHIIPICCGGTNDGDNLVYLYCTEKLPEHILAHKYLWKSTSLFVEYKSKLAGSLFKMTHSRKIFTQLSIEEAAKLREEYGTWKSKSLLNKYGKNKKANKIIYKGKEYPSSSSLTNVDIDGSKRDRHTILDWAREGKHGLSLASGEIFPSKPTLTTEERAFHNSRSINIVFNGKVYPSSRSLVGIELEGGIVIDRRSVILNAARQEKYGLKLLNEKDKVPKQNKNKKPKAPKIYLTKEERILRISKSIQILFKNKVYPSARSLETITMVDGKCHDKCTILSWARNNKNGLSIVKK